MWPSNTEFKISISLTMKNSGLIKGMWNSENAMLAGRAVFLSRDSTDAYNTKSCYVKNFPTTVTEQKDATGFVARTCLLQLSDFYI